MTEKIKCVGCNKIINNGAGMMDFEPDGSKKYYHEKCWIKKHMVK
jgi:hypothetical protein